MVGGSRMVKRGSTIGRSRPSCVAEVGSPCDGNTCLFFDGFQGHNFFEQLWPAIAPCIWVLLLRNGAEVHQVVWRKQGVCVMEMLFCSLADFRFIVHFLWMGWIAFGEFFKGEFCWQICMLPINCARWFDGALACHYVPCRSQFQLFSVNLLFGA